MRDKNKFVKKKSDRTETISAKVTPEVRKAFDEFASKNDMSKSSCLAWIVYNAIYHSDKDEAGDIDLLREELSRIVGVVKELAILVKDDELVREIAIRNRLNYLYDGRFSIDFSK